MKEVSALGITVKLCVLCPSLVSLCFLKVWTQTDTIMGVTPPPTTHPPPLQTFQVVSVEIQSSVIHHLNHQLQPDSIPHITHRVNKGHLLVIGLSDDLKLLKLLEVCDTPLESSA